MPLLAAGESDGVPYYTTPLMARLTQSFERHEILSDDESPMRDPVYDPLHQVPGYRALMDPYGMRICQ
ncbi:MAG: hypothetical protein ACJ8DJ_23040 [Gemmatimonadales bacterium]